MVAFGGDDPGLHLDEGEADVAEGIAHRGRLRTEPIAEPLHQAGDGVDRQRRRNQVRLALGEMDGGQLIQPHHVVRDDDFGRNLGDAAPGFVDRCLRVRQLITIRLRISRLRVSRLRVSRLSVSRPRVSRLSVSCVVGAHLRYPTWGN